jgi:hypothetical protein
MENHLIRKFKRTLFCSWMCMINLWIELTLFLVNGTIFEFSLRTKKLRTTEESSCAKLLWSDTICVKMNHSWNLIKSRWIWIPLLKGGHHWLLIKCTRPIYRWRDLRLSNSISLCKEKKCPMMYLIYRYLFKILCCNLQLISKWLLEKLSRCKLSFEPLIRYCELILGFLSHK